MMNVAICTYNNEYITLDTYHYKLGKTHQKVENITVTNEVLDTDERSASSSQSANRKKTLTLTRLELVKFGVEVKEWLGFWSKSKKINNEKDSETENEFQYLI
jgi:hypothetical protein